MTQNHYLISNLDYYGIGSQVIWSRQPVGKALVFVHGFGGKAVPTWTDFSSLLPREQAVSGHDLIFYGYDGTNTRSTVSAGLFRDFISDIFVRTKSIRENSLSFNEKHANPYKYSKITIVAHSLGAVISRDALLQGYQRKYDWAQITELVLFAPAHCGSKVVELAKETLSGFLIKFISNAALLNKYIALLDLEVGSPTLSKLEKDTLVALSSNASTLVAKKVIHAEKDKIVEPRPFANDLPAVIAKGCGHADVCKPNNTFLFPINEVKNSL